MVLCLAIALPITSGCGADSGSGSNGATDSNTPSGATSTPSGSDATATTPEEQVTLTLAFERLPAEGVDPFRVTVALHQDGQPLAGQSLDVDVPRGALGEVADLADGTYTFTVTPSERGLHPVTVRHRDVSTTRVAIVEAGLGDGIGQPLEVPGLVNTPGWEDGITITPDGEWLFIQYVPAHFAGLTYVTGICAEEGWALYDLTTCPGKPDSDWVFETIGPIGGELRPRFPTGSIEDGRLQHIDLTVPGQFNGLVLFPSVFYGFRRQSDGTFAEPFKVAFDDARGANGPFGLSFRMTGPDTADFVLAWNNFFDDLGDEGADVYHGSLTLGQDHSLGAVTYTGDLYQSITPTITPVNLPSHAGVQGNPHLHVDDDGAVRSLWTDDEYDTHDLSVYVPREGTFPDGTWEQVPLPPRINTPGEDSQPFFTGSRLYLNRDRAVVRHDFLAETPDAFSEDAAWGPEVVLLPSGDITPGGFFGFGEPTLAERDGRTWLYFVYVTTREVRTETGRVDFNFGAGFVELLD